MTTDTLTNELDAQPQDLEAEAAVLGSMVLDNEVIADVLDALKAGDFYAKRHRVIFEAAQRLHVARAAVDLITLRDDLMRAHALEDAGGIEYLTEICEAVPSAVNVLDYGRIVHEKSTRRALREAGYLAQHDAVKAEDVGEALDAAQKRLFEISDRRAGVKADSGLASILPEVLDEVDQYQANPGAVRGVPSGLLPLDALTGGFCGKEVVIIGARPSVGKTALALNIALHATLESRKRVPTLFFSLEMGCKAIMYRLLAAEAQVSATRIKRGILTETELRSIRDAAARLAAAPLYIIDRAGLTPSEVRAITRRHVRDYGVGLVVIDYLGLMVPDIKTDTQYRMLSVLSAAVKGIAHELDLPFIVLAQLNRTPEGRADGRPQMQDLRDSGNLEQDADIVALLHRPGAGHPDVDQRPATLIVTKNRNGEIGEIGLEFKAAELRFISDARL